MRCIRPQTRHTVARAFCLSAAATLPPLLMRDAPPARSVLRNRGGADGRSKNGSAATTLPSRSGLTGGGATRAWARANQGARGWSCDAHVAGQRERTRPFVGQGASAGADRPRTRPLRAQGALYMHTHVSRGRPSDCRVPPTAPRPARREHAMSAPRDAPTAYAASCNPPRRAKRHHTGSVTEQDRPTVPQVPASADKPQQRRAPRPPILPKQPQAVDKDYHIPPSPESDSGSEEDEYDPGRESTSAPKRRGRKPGTMSRTARESLRKLNHSKIEKARRTKINETLATLSTLVNDRGSAVPASPGQCEAPRENDGKGKKGKGKTEEKEFKLDVLVKAVEYMEDLIARVKALEGTMCAQCRPAERPSSPATKRKHAEDAMDVEDQVNSPRPKRPHHRQDEEDSYGGDDEHGLGNGAEEEQPSPMPFNVQKAPSKSPGFNTPSPRLPPIASWLPHPYVDPSSLMSASPSAGPVRSPTNVQLPSPPASGRFRPTATLASMPSLTLPGPAHPITTVPQGPNAPMPPRHGRKSVSMSPSVSPWTPEDETAASLLLQMSSKPSSVSSSRSPPTYTGQPGVPSPKDLMGSGRERLVPRAVEAVTPGSLLGMRD